MTKTVKLLTRNRSYELLVPIGIVIHETATPGATAQNEFLYFNGGDRGSSAHGFVDWNGYIQTIPYDEVAWHAGPTANHKYIGIEMCHAENKADFEKVWSNTVNVFVKLMKRFGFNSNDIFTHDYISRKWGETNHTDPTGYFKKFGKTFEDFINDVNFHLNGGLSMSQYEELKDIISRQEKEIAELKTKLSKVDTYIYNYIDDNMPDWAKPTIKKLVNKGVLLGGENGLNLNTLMMRILVILDRVGVFGK